jgi:hypothetical protein
MALAEELLTLIAKNQHEKDPYKADMLHECLTAVMKYYDKKDDRLLDTTLEVINSNLSQNLSINAVTPENITEDIIDLLTPKDLLQAQIWLVMRGKGECNENEKQRLRKLYIKVVDKLKGKSYN